MPSDRTTVTELGTALGMLGASDVDEALHSRTPVMHSVSPEMWARLDQLRAGGAYDAEFHAAFENGRAFLAADDGLRGRLPRIVEWKGTGRAPGDEVAPTDLRVDHVYLVSCKYLSNILFNVSPAHIFDDLLVGRLSRPRGGARDAARRQEPGGCAGQVGPGAGGDWYAEVAPAEYQALYEEVRRGLLDAAPAAAGVAPLSARGPAVRPRAGSAAASFAPSAFPGLEAGTGEAAGDPEGRRQGPPPVLRTLPARAVDLTAEQRDALGDWLKQGWPGDARAAYQRLADRVSFVSVHRWHQAMDERGGRGEAMLWRLLRMGSAPYFVLGSSATRSLRLRIATPWDWREHFVLGSVDLTEQRGGQPRVGWRALRCVIAPPPKSSSSMVTSRCAGAMAASADHPRRRAISTHRIISSRDTSRCNDHFRSHCAGPAAPRPGPPRQRRRPPALVDLGPLPGAAGLGRPRCPLHLVDPAPVLRRHGAGLHRAPAPARRARATESRSSLRKNRRPQWGSVRSASGCTKSRADGPRSVTGSSNASGAVAWPPTRCEPWSTSRSGGRASRVSISSSNHGTWHRPAPPRRPASSGKPLCAAGNASTANSVMPTVSPCSRRSGTRARES